MSTDMPGRRHTNLEAQTMREWRRDFEMSIGDLMELFGATQTTVHSILHGKIYADAGGPVETGRSRNRWSSKKTFKLSADAVRDVREDTASSHASLARKYQVSESLIRAVRTGKIYS
jgi:DNA-binding transcriptional regulator YiaG